MPHSTKLISVLFTFSVSMNTNSALVLSISHFQRIWLTLALFAISANGDGILYGSSLTELVSINHANLPMEIMLEDYPNYSTVIPLLPGRSNGTIEEVFEAMGNKTGGRFIVEAPINHGVMAVIQKLKFDSHSNNTRACPHFLEFDWSGCSIRINKTRRVCGQTGLGQDDHLVGLKTFSSVCEKLAINFAIEASNTTTAFLMQEMTFEIVFTAFKYCDIPTQPTNFTYRPCKGNNICISSNLFCDGTQNCGTVAGVGYDEKSCRGTNSKNWTASSATSQWLYNLAANISSKYHRRNSMNEKMSHSGSGNWAQFFCSILIFALFFAAIFFMMGIVYCVTNCCCLNSKSGFSLRPVAGLRYRISNIVNWNRGSNSSLNLHPREEINLDEAPPPYYLPPPPYSVLYPDTNNNVPPPVVMPSPQSQETNQV